MTLINAVYVVNKSTRPYSSVVSNDVYKGKRKKFISLVLICPIAIIPVLVKSALFVSVVFIPDIFHTPLNKWRQHFRYNFL